MRSEVGVRRGPKRLLLALWLVLTVAIVLSLSAVPWQRTAAQLRDLHAAWLVVAVAANLAILPLWAVEWRILLPDLARAGFRRMFEVVSVTAAVLNSIPFFAGEASGVALLITRVHLSRGAALSVLAMDQLLVGFAKLSVLAAAASFAPLPGWARSGLTSIVIGVPALLAVLLLLAHRGPAIEERLRASASRARRLASRLAAWGSHLETMRDSSRLWRVALLALAKKGVELAGVISVQLAFGMPPSVPVALLVLAALAVTTLLPVTPANLGIYEATVFASYRYIGIPIETALGIAIVQHVCFLLPALLTGYIVLTRRQLAGQRASTA